VALIAAGVQCVGASASGGSSATVHLLATSWSPRGSSILLDVEDQATGRLHLEKFDLAGQRPLQDLTPAAVRAYEASWSPNGRRIVFGASDPATSTTTRLYVMNADGRDRHLVARHAREAAWSPNGQKLVYWVEDYTRPIRLRIITASGSLVREIRFRHQLSLRAPFWSPDGKRIAFTANGVQGPVYSVRTDGTGLRRIAAGSLSFGVWARDWRRVVYWGGPQRADLYVAHFPYSHPRRLTSTHGKFDIVSATWAPSEKEVAYVGTAMSTDQSALFKVKIDGSRPVQLWPR
jgi:dipeptidyl aminopeptidase/acylaminoacyl peptidase